MITRIEPACRPTFRTLEAKGILSGARDWALPSNPGQGLSGVLSFGDLQEEEKTRIAKSLLADLVTQQYRIDQPLHSTRTSPGSVEVTLTAE